jgi:N-acyl homoserine lactone hydrolase
MNPCITKRPFYQLLLLSLSLNLLWSAPLSATPLPELGAKPPVLLKLYVLDCGMIEARDLSLFNPIIKKGTNMEMASPCYLIKHPKGNLLWDTGISEKLIDKPDGLEVFGGAFKLSVSRTLTSQLAQLNMDTDDIDYLAFSHLHNDHTGNAKLFTKAKWIMQQPEHVVSFGSYAEKYGYRPTDYLIPDANINILKLNGHHDVFDDGSVVMISTPGHSAGHQSLFVDLPDTGPVILSGDLYHFRKNRENYGIPVWNTKKETIHSFAFIDEILDSTGAQLWIHHDKEQYDAQKHSPEFYD